MVAKMLCSTFNIHLDQTASNFTFRSIRLYPENSKHFLLGLFPTPKDALGIGTTAVDELHDRPFFYYETSYTDEVDYSKKTELALEVLEAFVGCLWYVKDNSCNVVSLIGFKNKKQASSRRRNVFFSNSLAEFKNSSISIAELNEALQFFERIVKLSERRKPVGDTRKELGTISPSRFNSSNYNDFSRIERAISFLNDARCSAFLPSKISFYALVLESLFTTDSGEIQHKIAERVAKYLGGTTDDQLKHFNLIKKIYKVRSKYLHGQTLETNQAKHEKLVELSMELDEVLRRIFRKVLLEDFETFLLDNNSLTDWFNRLLFS